MGSEKKETGLLSKVFALGTVAVITATQASAAILPDDAKIDMTEFLLMASVVAGSYLVIKGVQKALGLLRGA
jgi:hypothetical protein